jgi:hypothetical protein
MSLRLRLEEELSLRGKPQLLVRLGKPLQYARPTPRRALDDVFEVR